jgi:hypothetical protein
LIDHKKYLIEGHYIHPVDIERTIKDDFAAEPAIRNRQMEARVHIEVQKIRVCWCPTPQRLPFAYRFPRQPPRIGFRT